MASAHDREATDAVLYRTVVLDTEAVTGAARRSSPA